MVGEPGESVQFAIPREDDALELILKLAGESCNVNCHYCFERRRPYDEARVLSPATLRKFLAALADRPLTVGLHGGEPLLIGRRRMADLLRELRAYPAPIQLTLQTNATLLDDAWLDFFQCEWPGLMLGLSVDGDATTSAHRVDHAGRPFHVNVA